MLQRTRELSALLDFAEVATQSLNTQKILNDTLDKSLESLGFKIGYIRILVVEAGGLVVRVARGLSSPQFMTNIVPLGSSRRSAGDIIFETREPIISSVISRMIHISTWVYGARRADSAAFVPVMSKNRVTGTHDGRKL